MLNNIQILRAFAALNVVLVHVIDTSATYGRPVWLFSPLTGWGQNGVDIFFVISGFVMVYTQAIHPKSAQAFITNRIRRIIPLYYLFTLCMLLIFLLAPFLFREMRPSFAQTVASFLMISSTALEGRPLVAVGWTLEYEMIFYGLFALGLLLKNSLVSFAFALLAIVLMAISGAVDAVVIEFALGMLCAKAYLSNRDRPFGLVSLVAGLLLLAGSIFIHPDLHRSISWGIPALLIVFGSLYVRQSDNKLLLYLGAASYSIYLVQVFSIPALYKISSMVLTFLPADSLAIVAVCFTAVLGCLTYEFVEKPLSRAFGKGRRIDERLQPPQVTTAPSENFLPVDGLERHLRRTATMVERGRYSLR
jgi:exopolysaccharide production protein ExoZ